jgi:predicted dehydrogenase
MCETVEEAIALVELAQEKQRVLQVGFLERFRLRRLLNEVPRLAPYFVSADRFATSVGREPDVDVVSDLMIHDIDLVLSLFQEEPAQVVASGITVVTGVPDLARVRLTFSNGGSAFLSASRISDKNQRRMGIGSSGVYASLDFLENEISLFARNQAQRFTKLGSMDPLLDELTDFVLSSREKREPLVTGASAIRSLRVRDSILSALKALPSLSTGAFQEISV